MNKYEDLLALLKSYGKVAIAYSGGCDSDFLLHAALQAVGKENVLAITCMGDMMSAYEQKDVYEYVKDIPHVILSVNVWEIPQFCHNDKKRCYYCKKHIMKHVIETAQEHGFSIVVDGKNKDDEGVYRPGIQACLELGIQSPLAQCGMSKQEVRAYSKQLQTKSYLKPANACLASRFDYDVELTKEKLQQVDQSEDYIRALGISPVRVRVQGELARIEVEKQDFTKLLANEQLVETLKAFGFRYVTLDVEGIRSGGYDEHKNNTGTSKTK